MSLCPFLTNSFCTSTIPGKLLQPEVGGEGTRRRMV